MLRRGVFQLNIYGLEPEEKSLYTYLVKRSKEGDSQAHSELYRLFVDAMYNISRRMMGDDDEAKDVLQDSFIEAFTKIHTLENEVTFPAWLKRIVVNKGINALRKRKMMTTELDENLDLPDPNNPSAGYDDDIIKSNARKVMVALDQISEGCRTVFNLYVFEGYDHKEIGQILSITESASKAQFSKAKSKIRAILESKNV